MDITLVLLIVFIVTARIIVTPAVPLDLPRATQSEEVQVVLSLILPPSRPALINRLAAPEDATILRLATDAVARDRECALCSTALAARSTPIGGPVLYGA